MAGGATFVAILRDVRIACGDANPEDEGPWLLHSLLRGSALEEELLRARIARRAQRPVVAEPRRNVPHPVVDDDHALDHRSEADDPDLVDLVGPDLEQLLGCLDLAFGSDGAGGVDQLDDFL